MIKPSTYEKLTKAIVKCFNGKEFTRFKNNCATQIKNNLHKNDYIDKTDKRAIAMVDVADAFVLVDTSKRAIIITTDIFIIKIDYTDSFDIDTFLQFCNVYMVYAHTEPATFAITPGNLNKVLTNDEPIQNTKYKIDGFNIKYFNLITNVLKAFSINDIRTIQKLNTMIEFTAQNYDVTITARIAMKRY